jgi:hypothetical protein
VIVAIELYFEVVRSRLVEIYTCKMTRIEVVVMVARPPAVQDKQPEAH